MTEASVTGPFLEKLRRRLPNALVIKHHDASFIGLPDCSVTHQGRIFWFEFKLWTPPKKWNGEDCNVQAIAEKSPTQLEMMRRMDKAAPGQVRYIVWVKKSGVCFIWSPEEITWYGDKVAQSDLVDTVASWIEYDFSR